MSLNKQFFRYVVPSIASMWIFSFYSLVDGVFVAKGVGEQALAAVNLSMPYINTVFSFGIVFAAGSSIVISIFLGQKNGEKANQYFNQNIVVVAALCVAFSIFTLLNMDFIVDLLGATGSTREYVKQYITVIAPFVVFYVVSYNLEVLVKTDGSPQVSILGVFTCAMTNVVLDYVFVIRFHWGVPGAAVATGIAQALSTVIFLLYFWKRGKHLQITKFKFDFSIYKRVIPLGIPDGMVELSNAIVIFAFNRVVLDVLGDQALVTYTIISYVTTLVLMSMSGTAQGTSPLISYSYGEGTHQKCFVFLKKGLITAVVFAVFFMAVCHLFAPQIVGIFLDDPTSELAISSAAAIRVYSNSYFPMGLSVIISGFFAAMVNSKSALAVSMGRGLFMPVSSLLVVAYVWGGKAVWHAPLISETLCLLLAVVLLCRYIKINSFQKYCK